MVNARSGSGVDAGGPYASETHGVGRGLSRSCWGPHTSSSRCPKRDSHGGPALYSTAFQKRSLYVADALFGLNLNELYSTLSLLTNTNLSKKMLSLSNCPQKLNFCLYISHAYPVLSLISTLAQYYEQALGWTFIAHDL